MHIFSDTEYFFLRLKPACSHENIVLWDEIDRVYFVCFYVVLLYVCVGCIEYFCTLD